MVRARKLASWICVVGITMTGYLTPAQATTPVSTVTGHDQRAAAPLDDRNLSIKQTAAIHAATSIYRHSVGATNRTLNYSKAKKFDKGRVAARRKFAAAWLWRGKKVSHISKAELKKVKRYSKGMPSWKSIGATPDLKAARVDRICTGDSYRVGDIDLAQGRFDVTWFYDSCDTKALLLWMRSVSFISGVLAAAGFVQSESTVAYQLAVQAAAVALAREIISYNADISSLNAVFVRDRWHLLTIGPQ